MSLGHKLKCNNYCHLPCVISAPKSGDDSIRCFAVADSYTFTHPGQSYGWYEFATKSVVDDKSKGYLQDGCFTLKVQIQHNASSIPQKYGNSLYTDLRAVTESDLKANVSASNPFDLPNFDKVCLLSSIYIHIWSATLQQSMISWQRHAMLTWSSFHQSR